MQSALLGLSVPERTFNIPKYPQRLAASILRRNELRTLESIAPDNIKSALEMFPRKISTPRRESLGSGVIRRVQMRFFPDDIVQPAEVTVAFKVNNY